MINTSDLVNPSVGRLSSIGGPPNVAPLSASISIWLLERFTYCCFPHTIWAAAPIPRREQWHQTSVAGWPPWLGARLTFHNGVSEIVEPCVEPNVGRALSNRRREVIVLAALNDSPGEICFNGLRLGSRTSTGSPRRVCEVLCGVMPRSD